MVRYYPRERESVCEFGKLDAQIVASVTRTLKSAVDDSALTTETRYELVEDFLISKQTTP
jgi:hypothetical protein